MLRRVGWCYSRVEMGIAAIGLALVLASGAGSREVDAESLAARGVHEYLAGRYEEAARDLQASYRLVPEPILMFNLGQCERAAGNLQRAIYFYRRYLAEAGPQAPNYLVALDRLKEALQAKARAGPAPAEPAAEQGAVPSDGGEAQPVPAPAVSETSNPAKHSHWVGASLAATAIVCAGFGIAGAVEVGGYLNDMQWRSQANANNWAWAAIVLGVATVASTTGAILTW